MNNCIDCGEKFSIKRAKLGYRRCLECGRVAANKERVRKSKCVAPAFNKGAYMYVSSYEFAKQVGK